ncbi:MAG: ankyrin repeat domain-containing protein [Planctomycetota bacterium]
MSSSSINSLSSSLAIRSQEDAPNGRRKIVKAAFLSGIGIAAARLLSDTSNVMAEETEKPNQAKSKAESSGGPTEADWTRDYEPPSFTPSWKKPQVNRQLAADFVVFAHYEPERVQKLLDRYPEVINAAVDWGGGDYETAIGGASHMGRHDIVEILLARGGRPDLFTLAMLGNLDGVKALLELEPKLIDANGPHGFSLHFHAQVGGERAKNVLEYLQSIKEVELRPVPFMNQN